MTPPLHRLPWTALLALLAAAGGARADCKKDSDCAVAARYEGCCPTCEGEPEAVLKAALGSERFRPPACGCAMPAPRGPVLPGETPAPTRTCAPVESRSAFTAACRRQRCVLVRVPTEQPKPAAPKAG